MQALHCRTLLRERLQPTKPVPGGNLHAVWIRCWNYDNQRFGIIVLISLSPLYIFINRTFLQVTPPAVGSTVLSALRVLTAQTPP